MATIMGFLRRTKGHKKLDYTDVISYIYLGIGVIYHVWPGIMVGIVLL